MRGALAGSVGVTVGVPLLDCFLNENGTALANGEKLPVRFGTYFWGLGLTHGPNRWVPAQTGPGYDLPPEIISLKGLENKVTVFSGLRVHLDGKPNVQHHTGHASILSGSAPPAGGQFEGPSFDTLVADEIGGGTRFRSLEITPYGSNISYSTRTGKSYSTPEITPISLYTRVFGEGFQDPNSDSWTPSKDAMLRKSVLSAVTDQRQALTRQVGAADKARLDQYFTSVRQMEEQLLAELTRPPKCESCVVPTAPEELPRNTEITRVNHNSRLMAELMAMAVACNQTKVFNAVHSNAGSGAYLPGDSKIYHLHTHDEAVDVKLGYQPNSAKLAALHFQGYADFVRAFENIKEGDGTLLDNCLIMGFSDTGNARTHATDNIPMFFAGKAGGRHKAGQHISAGGEPVTRVSLTAQQLIGIPIGEFGKGAMRTGKAFGELFA
jgi:hypothetical protein